MRNLIVTAADEKFLPLLRSLVDSLFQWGPLKRADLGVLDLGLGPETLAWLRKKGASVVAPGWDLALDRDVAREKPHLKAMTSRPFLPRHFPGYDMYLWLDADTWVQQEDALDWLLQAAATGAIAVVPQVDRCYRHEIGTVRWRLEMLRRYFGDEVDAGLLLTETYYNSGVFAMPGNAPHWDLWARYLREGLARCGGKFATDQAALNYMLWNEAVPVYPLPARCNWTTHLAMPEFRASDGLFHEPGLPGHPIGIMHLTWMMKDRVVEITGADGRIVKRTLRFQGAAE